jgi:hypothetical protein
MGLRMANSVGYRRCTMEIQADYKNFLEWCIKNGKSVEKEQEIYIKDGDSIRTEKRLARVVDISSPVVREYEDETGEKLGSDDFIIRFD